LIVFLIISASVLAVLETEPMLMTGNEALFRSIEWALTGLFLVEYIARVWTCVESATYATGRFPRLRYMATPMAIIDLLAIAPTFLAEAGGGYLIIRVARGLRLLTLLRLGRFSRAWQHLAQAVRSRQMELLLTLGIGIVGIIFSASALYWIEGKIQPDDFGSIPRALWWSVITLTSVGYGDAAPITPLGKIVGGMVAILGVALIAIPTGILAAAFSDAFRQHREAEAQRHPHQVHARTRRPGQSAKG
jgi:voltage-gated potassium channel